MAKKRVESWVVTDAFWQRVEPLLPKRKIDNSKVYQRKPGAGRPPKPARQVFEAIVYVLRTGCQWISVAERAFWQCQRDPQALFGMGGSWLFRDIVESQVSPSTMRLKGSLRRIAKH